MQSLSAIMGVNAAPCAQTPPWLRAGRHLCPLSASCANSCRSRREGELCARGLALTRLLLCFAHFTNLLAQIEGDFEKGETNGARDALEIITAAAWAWRNLSRSTTEGP